MRAENGKLPSVELILRLHFNPRPAPLVGHVNMNKIPLYMPSHQEINPRYYSETPLDASTRQLTDGETGEIGDETGAPFREVGVQTARSVHVQVPSAPMERGHLPNGAERGPEEPQNMGASGRESDEGLGPELEDALGIRREDTPLNRPDPYAMPPWPPNNHSVLLNFDIRK